MEVERNLSDHDIVLRCIRGGIKAIDIAGYLSVNPSSISKIKSRKIKSFSPKLHERLLLLYQFVKLMGKDVM
jgi:hypothetical protein